jgi:hypothetical protein
MAALKKGSAREKYGVYIVVALRATTIYSISFSPEKPFFR